MDWTDLIVDGGALRLPEGYEVEDLYPVTTPSGDTFIRVVGTMKETYFGLDFRILDAGGEIIRSLRTV